MLDAAEWTMVAYIMVICFGIGWCCAKMFSEGRMQKKYNDLCIKHYNLEQVTKSYHKQLIARRLEIRKLENAFEQFQHHPADYVAERDNGKIYNDGA